MSRVVSRFLRFFIICLQAVFLLFLFTNSSSAEDVFSEGKKVYEKYCIGCHGKKGDGKGAAAGNLLIKPRDLTRGQFKFKSTPISSLPTDEDFKRALNTGLPTSPMPNFRLTPDDDKDKVIAYIKGFSDRWKKEKPEKRFADITIPDFVGAPDSVKKGESLFTERCQRCHGSKGEKFSPAFPTFFLKWTDKEYDLTRPANFNHAVIKRGLKVEDIYLSITAGVEGTPMMSYRDLLSENNRWHLTSYVLTFMGNKKTGGK